MRTAHGADQHPAGTGDPGTAGAEVVCELIRERIRRGHYDRLGRLPDESVLARELDLSRSRVRAALETLSQEGTVLRLRGRGTFVPTRLAFLGNHHGGFTRWAREAHQAVAAHRVLSATTRPMDVVSSADFDVTVGTPTHLVERCSYLDGSVFSTASYVVRGDLAPGMLVPELLRRHLDMRAWLAEAALLPLGWVDTSLEACSAESHAADLLGCPRGAPLLRLNRHFHLVDGRLLAHGSHVFRGDRYTYQVVREQLALPPDLSEIHPS